MITPDIIAGLMATGRAFEIKPDGSIFVHESGCTTKPKTPSRAKVVEWNPSQEQLTVSRWFRRRDSTAWDARERKVWSTITFSQDEFDVLNSYYSADIPPKDNFRRHDLLTLLNNWNREVDRARRFLEAKTQQPEFRL